MMEFFNCSYVADINECTSGEHKCHDNATCANMNGSYFCTCKSPFTGSGTKCLCEYDCMAVDLIRFIQFGFVVLCFFFPFSVVMCPLLNASGKIKFTGKGKIYKSTRLISCPVGFTLQGENKTTCQLDGTWSRFTSSCKGM